MHKIGVVLLFCFPRVLDAQTLHALAAHPPTSIRGLSTPGQGVLWASGTGGTVGRSLDGGAHWTWTTVPGFGRTDFRDIEGFDASRAEIMGIDTPAVILRTVDGGVHWSVTFRDPTPGMFLDAMAFQNQAEGVVVGDPVQTSKGLRFFVTWTEDSGRTWDKIPAVAGPPADSAEGCFASSGTNIIIVKGPDFDFDAFVSGGPVSRLFLGSGNAQTLPLRQGAPSTGANSIAVDGRHWIVVGGDFAHDTISRGNCTYSMDAGRHWLLPHIPPHGYRSCVVHLAGDTWLCCGTSGVDMSYDNGDHWALVSAESFHVAAYPGSGHSVYLAGARGRIARLDW